MIQGPYLPGLNLPHQHFPAAQFAGAQFTTKLGMVPICQKWHTRPQKVWGPIYHQIGEGSNLPKNGTLGPKKCGAQFTAKLARAPICRGPICKKWHPRPQKVRGPIYHQIGERPNLPKNGTQGPKQCGAQFTTKLARGPICRSPICRSPICLEPLKVSKPKH